MDKTLRRLQALSEQLQRLQREASRLIDESRRQLGEEPVKKRAGRSGGGKRPMSKIRN